MGNQIYGMTSPQVIGCEECLRELQAWFTFEEELWGSRMFKVAKVKCVGGKRTPRRIVKIFPYSKTTFSIDNVKKIVVPFCRCIEGAINLLPLNSDFITDKYAFIIRDFVAHSLPERLCTRPFLTLDEKRWISFQLLSAINQLHTYINTDSTPLCHGDIKSENVLLTTWGWLFLVDPAPFKPTRLPADNPSEFTYFFDSSRRRVCYLAPERFVDPSPVIGVFDIENFSSVPEFSNLRDNADPVLEEVSLAEVADENLQVSEKDSISRSLSELDIQVVSPAVLVNVDKKSEVSGADETIQDTVRLRLISDSCLASEASSPPNAEADLADVGEQSLQPSMDLFSAGCVLLEMFTDGSVAFTLSELLAYRRHQNTRVRKLLASIRDPDARSLITELLSLDPGSRGTAAHHLSTHRGGLFPDFFFTNLQPFMHSFLEPSMNSPDSRLRRIRANLPNLVSNLLNEPDSTRSASSIVLCNLITATMHLYPFDRANPVCAAYFNKAEPSIETNNIPSEDAKLDALFCLLLLTDRLPSLRLFNRLWPHFVEFFSDARLNSSEVRCLALEGLVQILESSVDLAMREQMQKEEALEEDSVAVISDPRFLNEFLLPSLAPLAQDPVVDVRITLAQYLPRIAIVCSKLLELARRRITKEQVEEGLEENLPEQDPPLSDVGTALRLMDAFVPTRGVNAAVRGAREALRDRLIALFSDDSAANFVRRTLMGTATGIAALATFLGPSNANDAILSHMITFLNDKKDANQRAAFFNQVPSLVGLLGAQSVTVLRPLLEQGLADPHETVLVSCLRALSQLHRRSLLSAPAAISFLHRILALTAHPAAYVRQACISYVTTFARVGMQAYTVSSQGPLDDQSIEATESSVPFGGVCARPPPAPLSNLGPYAMGTYGISTVYAHLTTPEVTETIFERPITSCFTNDGALLAALKPSLSHAFLDGVVATVFDVAREFEAQESPKSSISPRQLCNDLKDHLQERQAARQATRKGETPWYPAPSNDAVSEILNRLRLCQMNEQTENQLLRLAPLIVGMCQSVSDPTQLSLRSTTVSSALRAANQLVRVFPPPGGDLPLARIHHLPATISGVMGVRRMELSTSPVSNPEVTEPPPNTKVLEYPLVYSKPEPSFVEIISSRIGEGRIPLPVTPPATAIFARALTIAPIPGPTSALIDDARGCVAALRISSGSGGSSSRPLQSDSETSFSGLQVRCSTAACPEWALCNRRTSPRLYPLAHVHEHKAGHLSLATHPSGHLLVSCSSGDGLVKFWDCGRAAHASSSQLVVATEDFVEHVTGDDDQISINTNTALDDLVTVEVEKSAEDEPDVDAFVGRSLPSRSFATYSVRQPKDASAAKPSCRWVVWTECGSSVATLANHSAIHLIDSSLNCLRSLFPVQTTHHGMATYLTGPAVASNICGGGPFQSYTLFGTDQNLLAYSTTSGSIVGQDIRNKEPTWVLKQDRDYGLITCLTLHSGHTWLAAGTNHGHLVNWDLRYQRAISTFSLPYKSSVGFTRLLLYDWQRQNNHSAVICAATDQHNEVALFDLEESNPRWRSTNRLAATWTQNTSESRPLTPSTGTSQPIRAVRSLLLLPPPPTTPSMVSTMGADAAGLPNLVTGGTDSRIRCWSFARPDTSAVLVWSGIEEGCRPHATFSEKLIDGVRVVAEEGGSLGEQLHQKHPSRTQSLMDTSDVAFSKSPGDVCVSPLEVGGATIGHTNAISDLALANHTSGHVFLISAAMNGVIKFWK